MIRLLKKFARYAIVILGVMFGYQFMTGKSITTLPGELFDILQQKNTATKSTNPNYYRDPAKDLPNDLK